MMNPSLIVMGGQKTLHFASGAGDGAPHGWPCGFVYAQALPTRGSMPMPLVLDKLPIPSEDESPPAFFDVFQNHTYACADRREAPAGLL
jgi:hypothetical protein